MKEYYEMFTAAGNKACVNLVKKVSKKIEGKNRLTQEDVITLIKEEIKKVAEKYPEVHDTEPEWHITDEVNKSLKNVGYGFTISRWDF